MKISETYWNYTKKASGQTEQWKNGVLENGEYKEIEDYDVNNIGKYSSLMQAIKGFIHDECNPFSAIAIDFDESDRTKFRLHTEVYYDYLGNPVNDVVFRAWKNGKDILTHAYVDAIFIRHTNEQASVKDFAAIKSAFPNIKAK